MGALAVLAPLLAGCGEPPLDRVPGPAQLQDVPEVVGTIVVDDEGFDPAEQTITAGEALELVNEGDEPHGFDGGEGFGTGLLEPGESTTLVLREPGELPYRDPAHPEHEGRIVVEPGPEADAES